MPNKKKKTVEGEKKSKRQDTVEGGRNGRKHTLLVMRATCDLVH